MPFDGTDFEPRPPAPPPRRRSVSKRDEAVLLWLSLLAVAALLLTPVSLGALVDVVRFVQGRLGVPARQGPAHQKRLPGTPLNGPASREVIQPP